MDEYDWQREYEYEDGQLSRCREEVVHLSQRLAEVKAELEASENHVRLIRGIADRLRAEANAPLNAAAPLLLAALKEARGNIDDSWMSLEAYCNLVRQIDDALDAAEEDE